MAENSKKYETVVLCSSTCRNRGPWDRAGSGFHRKPGILQGRAAGNRRRRIPDGFVFFPDSRTSPQYY